MFELDMSFPDYVGIFGALTYLAAYTGLQLGRIPGVGYTYPSLILIAAGCVLFSLTSHFNPSAVIIQTSFIAISLFGIARRRGCVKTGLILKIVLLSP